jgi:hypothetical protein
MKYNYSVSKVANVVLAAALVLACGDDDDADSNTGGNTAGVPVVIGDGNNNAGSGPFATGGTGPSGAGGALNAAGTTNTGGDDGENSGNTPIIDAGVVNNPDDCPATAPDDDDPCEAPEGFLLCAYEDENCRCFAGNDNDMPTWNCGAFGGGMMGGGNN